MTSETLALAATAASLGFIHTLAGPDHYVPFIMIAKARNWSLLKTAIITVLCGIGHIFSAVLLGIIGLGFGFALSKIEAFDSMRDNIAAWLFIAFGLVYFVWGIRKAFRNDAHTHYHGHGRGHESKAGGASITPWVLFAIFVFGPCEVLIPLLMYPAARSSLMDAAYVTLIFGAVTITTMLGIVMVSMFGFNLLPIRKLERYTHALAGLAIVICGVIIIV